MGFVARVGLITLTVLAGCVRFGYDAVSRPDAGGGGASGDSGTPQRDGSVEDAASADGSVRPDTGTPDAADGDAASGSDSGGSGSDSGPSDGSTTDPTDGGSSDGSMGPTDSGATDSGAMDSGPIELDGGGFDDPKRTAQCPDIPGAVFCDGFEGTDFSLWTYSVEKNGTVERSTTRVRTGSGSLYAHTNLANAPETAARLSIKAVDQLRSGSLFARYFYFVPTVPINMYLSSAVLSEYDPPFYGFSVVISQSEMGLASGSNIHWEPQAFPRDQWVCVEMHVLIADSQGSWAFYREGSVIWRESGIDTLPNSGMTMFEVGIHFAPNGQEAADAYVDDVVVGTERIGCTAGLTPP